MQLKSNIRRRRKARIRSIRRMLSKTRAGGQQLGSGVQPHVHRHQQDGTTSREENLFRMNRDQLPADPEEAWKRKMAAWNRQAGSNRIRPGRGRKAGFLTWHVPAWGGLNLAGIAISIGLFVFLWGLYQVPASWAQKTQIAISDMLREPFDVRKAANWYEERFGGSPAWIPIWNRAREEEAQTVHSQTLSSLKAPAKGAIVTPFSSDRQGMHIRVSAGQPIRAADRGRVVFNGQTSSGRTIVIQHPDHIRTVYGMLDETVVDVNSWVEQGDVIANGIQEREPGEGLLYFSVRVGDEYVDPVKVVSFD